ncbi:MAG: YbaK/EbsC family protein [Syntrophomonadaceae bacterium]|jgi:prolyl-tRNA editing enzyme YbaK/EbsC (Cys-tRNA(Pro) deacylase)
MQEVEKVREFLQERNPELNIIQLAEDISTSELAAQALGTEVGQIAKSMLFKTKQNGFVLVVSAGDVKVDSKLMKDLVGSRVRMARAEEVEEVTGFKVGGVCPFALKEDILIYLDESLKRYDIVYTAAGTAKTALPIGYQELVRITEGKPCRVCN